MSVGFPSEPDPRQRDVIDHSLFGSLAQSASVMGARALGAISALGLSLLIARIFGAELTGTYYLGVTVVSIAATLGRAGLDLPIMRVVATSTSSGDRPRARGAVRVAVAIATAVSTVLALTILILRTPISSGFGAPNLAGLLVTMSLGVVPLALLSIVTWVLRAVGRPVLAELLVRFGVGASSIAVVLIFWRSVGITAAAVAFVVSHSVMAALAFLLWRRLISSGPASPVAMRSLLRPSVQLLIAALMTFVIGWSDTIMLGVWSGAAEVGVYGAAVRVAAVIGFVLQAVNAVFLPQLAAAFSAMHLAGLKVALRRAAAAAIGGALPLTVAVVLAATPLLALFGEEFTAGATALVILALGNLISVVLGPIGYLLTVIGKESAFQISVSVAAVTNIALNALLIPPYGIEGAAYATLASLAIMGLLGWWLSRRELRLVVVG